MRRCIEEGLVGGEGFAVDASLIRADANKQRSAERSEPVDWRALAETRRSVQEYLDTLDDAAWGAASQVKPNGARDEFHLAAAAQNLRKLAKLIPMGTPKPA